MFRYVAKSKLTRMGTYLAYFPIRGNELGGVDDALSHQRAVDGARTRASRSNYIYTPDPWKGRSRVAVENPACLFSKHKLALMSECVRYVAKSKLQRMGTYLAHFPIRGNELGGVDDALSHQRAVDGARTRASRSNYIYTPDPWKGRSRVAVENPACLFSKHKLALMSECVRYVAKSKLQRMGTYLAYFPIRGNELGGVDDALSHQRAADGARTRDPRLGKPMLYRLSYYRNYL